MRRNKKWEEWLWDAWCIASLVGIWPRFIEPNLLSTTRLTLKIPHLPTPLNGFKILHFSDLHWNPLFSPQLLRKIPLYINRLQPDMIALTGDTLTTSRLMDQEGLKTLLNQLHAPYGCFAVLGNHDYSSFVTVNTKGDYDVVPPSSASNIKKGMTRLWAPPRTLTKRTTETARQVVPHHELVHLLQQTPFQLLNNTTQLINVKGTHLNICGVEEYTTGRIDPKQTFKDYQTNYPGIILAHNPDALPLLENYPGDLILSGHTHGGEVNLPFLWKKFALFENHALKRGLKKIGNKWIYVNRGVGSGMKFRWFSMPELTLITLQG